MACKTNLNYWWLVIGGKFIKTVETNESFYYTCTCGCSTIIKNFPIQGFWGQGNMIIYFKGTRDIFLYLLKELWKKIIGNNEIYLSNSFSYILCVRSSAETTRVLKNAILTFIRSWRYWLLASWLTGSVLVSAMGKTNLFLILFFN